jgi:ADYC domain
VSSIVPLAALAAVLVVLSAATHAQARLTVEGTEFVLATRDGRTLRSADLVGTTLNVGGREGTVEITVKGVEVDRYAVGGRVVLHRFVAKEPSGKAVDLCMPDAGGHNHGFPVPDGRGGFELTCTSGAIGKCIRWGYRYWEEQPGGPPLRALHRACVHMARADYGGDGTPNTRDGTLIDIHDHFGIQRFDRVRSMAFEAAWGEHGAICVARTRVAETVSLAQLAERYPELAPRLGLDTCTEDAAMHDPAALLFNRSRR